MARGVKLPETGECFDYHFEVASKETRREKLQDGLASGLAKRLAQEWAHWETCVKPPGNHSTTWLLPLVLRLIEAEMTHNDTLRKYEPVAEVLYQNIVISNVELERMKPGGLVPKKRDRGSARKAASALDASRRHLLDLHVKRQKPMLLVGVAGRGRPRWSQMKPRSSANRRVSHLSRRNCKDHHHEGLLGRGASKSCHVTGAKRVMRLSR